MALFERDFAKEMELVDDLLNGLDYDSIPIIVDATARGCVERSYLREIEAYHDTSKMRKVVRGLLIEALEILPREGYEVTAASGHKWYEYRIGGQFEVVVAYDPSDGTYDGEVRLDLIQCSTW